MRANYSIVIPETAIIISPYLFFLLMHSVDVLVSRRGNKSRTYIMYVICEVRVPEPFGSLIRSCPLNPFLLLETGDDSTVVLKQLLLITVAHPKRCCTPVYMFAKSICRYNRRRRGVVSHSANVFSRKYWR